MNTEQINIDLNKDKIIKVFIDLDNTLLPFDSLIPTWKAIIKSGRIPSFPNGAFRKGFKSIPKHLMVSCFMGNPIEEYLSFFSKLANHFADKTDPEVKGWAEGLLKDKAHIHIVTGSLVPLADGISKNLSWGKIIGTDVEIKNGILTGKLKSNPIKGYQKLIAVKNTFHLNDEDFRFCAAAGDSYSDRYLMEHCSLKYFPTKTSKRLISYFSSI